MNFKSYAQLMRLHKPIGIFLLLWPTLWALWLASAGKPNVFIVIIFVMGTVLMRSAGCVINDFADRHVDKYVARTRERPLTSGKVTVQETLILFVVLMLTAFMLVLLLNWLTILLAVIAAVLAVSYPFLKRVTHLPQVGLGINFSWGVPMAFAAQNNVLTVADGYVFLATVIWAFMYDTVYAMVDRQDDIKIGVKSTAILFGNYDKVIIALLQLIFLAMLCYVGYIFHLRQIYFVSVFIAGLFFCYQQWLIKNREPDACFKAFLNNNWVGLIIFVGILLS
jgi:4-hydroxybenzoate polyprenyltransferase